MRDEVVIPASYLLGFLLVLTRLAGAFVMLPFPGAHAAPAATKIVFSVALTLSLAPMWPSPGMPGVPLLLGWLLSEALLGITFGLVVALFHESFGVASQIIALQAGYSYASTVDPTSQTDAGLFPILMQLVTGLLFFAADLHLVLWRAIVNSLYLIPPGAFRADTHWLEILNRSGSYMLELGLKVALPITALLLLIDLALALLGRLNAQLQLLSLSFPVKMLGSLAAVGALLMMLPKIYNKATPFFLEPLSPFLK